MASLAQLDALFGPQLPGHFDFTILFEHSMLWIVPTGVAILITPFYFNGLLRSERQVRPGFLLWIKVACGLALVGIQACDIALWHNTHYFRSRETVIACSMSLVASICTLAIIILSHLYSLQPSTFLSIFFSITMLFDITMARSYFFRETLGVIAALQVCVVVLKLWLILLEEVPKRSLYRSSYLQATISVEAASGFWGRSFFLWINPILIFGWRSSFTIDTLPNIGEEFASEKLFDLFSSQWTKVSKSSKLSLVYALVRTLRWKLAKVFLPRLCYVGVTIAQPFLLLSTVSAVSSGSISRSTSDGLIGAGAIICFILATSRTLFEHWEYRAVTFIRGILIVAIYDKMQRLRAEDLQGAAAVTLMSVDVDGTETLVSLAYEALSCTIQLSLGIWVLYRFVSVAAFLIFVPTILTFIGSLFTGSMIATARAATNAEAQKRVAATSNILAQIKSIKSMGLSGSLSAYIEHKRENEIKIAMRERYSVLWTFGFGAINYTISPAVVFSGAYFWTRADNPMSVAEVFAILAVLSLCTSPLITLFRSVTAWAAGISSIGRIYEYLIKKELQDERNVPSRASRSVAKAKGPAQPRKPFAFDLKNVSVTSPTTGPTLKAVSLSIPWGALSMIWGPIGSGKSTLLRVLLGEVELNSGEIVVGSSTAAYCGQETWITNCTVRQAIVGPLEFEEARYRSVTRACCLDSDMNEWPEGDQTKTGSGGCNLSGGQRQRVSLARAAFAEEDVIIVDDIFSSVDPDTAATIFERLFGPKGLVRQWNCTVVMSTNRLELLDFADQIYLFSKDGRVTLQNGNEADVSTDSTNSGEDESNEEALGSNRSRISGSDKDTEPPQVQAKKSIEEPESNSGTIDLSLYSYFLRSAGIPALLGWVSFAMISAVGEWAPVLFIRIWFSKSPENKRYFGIYAALAVLCVIFNVASGAFYFTFVFTKITKDMHGRLLRATMGATPQYHNNTDSGVLLNRFGQDISLITRRLALLINQLLFVVFTTLLEIALVASGSAYSVPMILCIVVVLCSIQFFYLRSSRQLRQLELESSAALFTQFTEATDGIQHIRSFGWEDAFRRRLYARLDRSQKPRYLLYCIQRWLTLSTDITSAVATVVIIAIATKLPGKTTDAAVGLAMLSLIGFSTTATTFIQYWTSLETSLGAVRRVKQFVINTPQEKDDVSSDPLPVVWPSAGTIDFNALTATYKTSDEKEHTAIEDLTVTLRGKQKIGLMGRTGSGKSTVISALLRMVDYTGSISIDGLDTRRVPRELLRSKITTIPQDGLRLNESLRFNLYPFAGERPSDDEMIGALQTVGVWNHARANGGLDADYFKLEFSKGQKQLIFLARAILHQRKTGNRIVLMDEVTSSMAEDAEPELQRLIDVAFSGCTIIMVSHRMESFQTADVILRFSSGKIDRVLRRRSNGSLVEG